MSELVLSLVGLTLATAFVLALAYVCLRGLKRLQPKGPDGETVSFLRAVPIGPRERVTLVRYRGEVFMLGVAGGSVSLLARFDDSPADEGPEKVVVPPPFASRRPENVVTRLSAGNARENPS